MQANTALQLGDFIGWTQVCSILQAGRGKEVSALVSVKAVGHPNEFERSEKGEPRRQG